MRVTTLLSTSRNEGAAPDEYRCEPCNSKRDGQGEYVDNELNRLWELRSSDDHVVQPNASGDCEECFHHGLQPSGGDFHRPIMSETKQGGSNVCYLVPEQQAKDLAAGGCEKQHVEDLRGFFHVEGSFRLSCVLAGRSMLSLQAPNEPK